MKKIEQHKKMFILTLEEIHGFEIDEAVKKTINDYTKLIIDTEVMSTEYIDRKKL